MSATSTSKIKKEGAKVDILYQSIKNNEKEVIRLKELCLQLEETTKKITSGFEQYGESIDQLLTAKKNLDILIEQLNSYLNIQEKIAELRSFISEPSEILRVFFKIESI